MDLGARGRASLEVAEYSAASYYLWEALRLSPRGPMTTYLLGVTLMFQGEWDQGRRLVERAYKLRNWLDDRLVSPDAVDMLTEASRRFPDWAWPEYQLARVGWRAVGLEVTSAVNHLALESGRTPTFLQIGANDGRSGDPLRRLIPELGMDGVFVEPQPGPMASLRQRYASMTGLRFAEVCITEEDGPVALYTDPSRTTLGTLEPERNLMRNRSAVAEELAVDGLTFASFAERFEVDTFDLLQIDTEGHDYRILKQIPLDDHGVQMVNLEYICLPIEERLASARLLVDHGFALFFDNMDLLAVRGDGFEKEFAIARVSRSVS